MKFFRFLEKNYKMKPGKISQKKSMNHCQDELLSVLDKNICDINYTTSWHSAVGLKWRFLRCMPFILKAIFTSLYCVEILSKYSFFFTSVPAVQKIFFVTITLPEEILPAKHVNRKHKINSFFCIGHPPSEGASITQHILVALLSFRHFCKRRFITLGLLKFVLFNNALCIRLKYGKLMQTK